MQQERRPARELYRTVDWYVTICFVKAIAFFFLLAVLQCWRSNPAVFWPIASVVLVFMLYRILDVLQSWVSQFVLGGVPQIGWRPRNIHRSLVLVFMNYFEVVFYFASFALVWGNAFDTPVVCWRQALYYSVGNAITMGTVHSPVTSGGYAIFGIQIVFVLLFLVAAVNRIFGYRGDS